MDGRHNTSFHLVWPGKWIFLKPLRFVIVVVETQDNELP
jgi:hypothetical protein